MNAAHQEVGIAFCYSPVVAVESFWGLAQVQALLTRAMGRQVKVDELLHLTALPIAGHLQRTQ